LPKLASHLGHLHAEVKAYLADRLSLAPLRALGAHLLDGLYPSADGGAHGLDAAHWARLNFLEHGVCEMCAHPFAGGLWLGAGSLCEACTGAPFPFQRTRAACLYDEASRDLILSFKHGDRLDLAPMLSRWLERVGRDILSEADLVLPVPLHPARLRHRRYNQAAELARPLARRFKLSYAPGLLRRIRPTSQAGKSAEARWQAVRNAFAVPPRAHPRLAGRRIVLIDDVFTTGATLKACARTLLAAGAAQVDVCVLARTASL
jgi:ComF family protein